MCLLLFAVQALACESDKKHSAATSAGVETGSSSESGGASTGPAVTPCDERMTAEACADGGVIDSVLRCRWQGNIATWTAQDACPSLPGGVGKCLEIEFSGGGCLSVPACAPFPRLYFRETTPGQFEVFNADDGTCGEGEPTGWEPCSEPHPLCDCFCMWP